MVTRREPSWATAPGLLCPSQACRLIVIDDDPDAEYVFEFEFAPPPRTTSGSQQVACWAGAVY
jgi:hypothetical protein